MSTSKFQQLADIIDEDRINTDNYLKDVYEFIRTIGHKLANYLECNLQNIFIIDSKENRTQITDRIQGFVTFNDDGVFKFNLLVLISEKNFDSNRAGKSFFDKGLTTPSGIILPISIKYYGEKNFTVESPVVDKGQLHQKSNDLDYEFDNSDHLLKITNKSFQINPDDNTHWSDFLESLFQLMKEYLQIGLEQRINSLRSSKDNISQLNLGFR
jgi:hypothetical protein